MSEISEAITSSQLEGAATTRKVAKEMIRSGRSPRDRSEQIILNNYLTMQRIRKLKSQPLSKELVLEIHQLVTQQTLDDPSAAGRACRRACPGPHRARQGAANLVRVRVEARAG